MDKTKTTTNQLDLSSANGTRELTTTGVPPGLRDFLVISLCIFVVLGATNSSLFFQQGWHFIVLFGGLAYGYRWTPRSQERSFS